MVRIDAVGGFRAPSFWGKGPFRELRALKKLADKRLGLLLNFNVVPIESGITRIVNGLKE